MSMYNPTKHNWLWVILLAVLVGMGWTGRVAQGQQIPTPTPNLTLAAVNATLEALRQPPQTPTPAGAATATPTVTPSPTASPTATATPSPTVDPGWLPFDETQVVTNTVFLNQTDETVLVFAEGQTYQIPAQRGVGIEFTRSVAAITLYTCPAQAPESRTCYWDPYPVEPDQFYEIVVNQSEATIGVAPPLIISPVARPQPGEIHIHNRTGQPERFLHQEALYEVENGALYRVPLDGDGLEQGPGDRPLDTLFLRRCVALAGDAVCEWLPYPVMGGVTYGLLDETRPGSQANSAETRIWLQALAGEPSAEEVADAEEAAPEEAPPISGLACQSQIPALNVRAGPGTEYLVIGQLRTAEPSGGAFTAIGQNPAGSWLALSDADIAGGWVSALPQFVRCDAATGDLPIAEITDGRLTPVAAAPATAPPFPGDEDTDEAPVAEAPAEVAPGIPEGRARLIVRNSFEAAIRFTLDAAQHGLPEGTPSEYDLAPDQSIELLIWEGRVQFSASTPFRGGWSGNAEFAIDEGESRTLFLHFRLSEDGSEWQMRYE